jgi:ribosomal-protein-alanine N-acetyltransferase
MDAAVLPMRTHHLRAIAEIERTVFNAPWSAEMLRGDLSGPCSSNFIAFRPDTGVEGVVGYVCSGIVSDECTLNRIACAPGCCGQGIGKMLVSALLRHAAKAGARAAFLEVAERNAPAIALYASCGFSPAGRRKNYYSETGEDAIVMMRSELPQPCCGAGV